MIMNLRVTPSPEAERLQSNPQQAGNGGWLRLFQAIRPVTRAGTVRDAFAGFQLAAMNIPQALGYTKIAGVRPIPITSNCGFIQPSHARLYRPGISFRFVRSPEAPKRIRTQESPVGIGSCDNFSRGLPWIIADISFLSLWMLSISFSNRHRKPTYSSEFFFTSLAPALPVLFRI